METGERWAYRQGAEDPVVEVEVLRLGTRRPPRVLIRHLDVRFEGGEEWVPRGRLKVPWAEAGAWAARDGRWKAARAASRPARETTELHAAEYVFDIVGIDALRSGYGADTGLLLISSLACLPDAWEMDPAVLTVAPSFVDDDGTVVAAWPAMQLVAERAAPLVADRLLEVVAEDEAESRQHAVYGYYLGDTYISAETCARSAAQFRPVYDLLRRWCGVEAVDRADELEALRAEVRRLGHLVERAVSTLESSGNKRHAEQLARDLGVPIETVRQLPR